MALIKTVLITGGSSGIGLELAKLFAKDGYRIVLVARQAEALKTTARMLERSYKAHVHTITKDLSLPASSSEIIQELNQKQIPIDALVNNAGVGVYGDFKDTDMKQELAMIEINISALTALTKLFLPQMLDRKSGKILHVASIAGFVPGPGMSVYYATKAYVLSFSEALREELRGSGVSVTTLCPGPTKTNFDVNAGAGDAKIFTGPGIMSAEAVAKIGYDALMKNKMTVVAGMKNKLFVFLVRFAPRAIVPRVVRWIQSE